MKFVMQDFPILLIPIGLTLMLLQDSLIFLVRRNFDWERRCHRWVSKISIKGLSDSADIVEKSRYLLPGWKYVIGSFPRYFAVVLAIYLIRLGDIYEAWFWFLPAGIISWYLAEWILSKVLVFWLSSQYSKQEF